MKTKNDNHDALVRLILEKVGPIEELESEVLSQTDRRFVTRLTLQKAFEHAGRLAINNDLSVFHDPN